MMIVIIMMMLTMIIIIIMVLDSIVGQFGFFVGAVASGEKVLSAGEIAPSAIIPIILFIIIVIIIITIIIFVIVITFFVCYLEPLRPPMNPPRTSKTPKNRLKILTIPTLAPALPSQTPQIHAFFCHRCRTHCLYSITSFITPPSIFFQHILLLCTQCTFLLR